MSRCSKADYRRKIFKIILARVPQKKPPVQKNILSPNTFKRLLICPTLSKPYGNKNDGYILIAKGCKRELQPVPDS